MIFSTRSLPAQFHYESHAFRPGETLTYKVKWGFLRLGTLVVKQEYADPDYPQYMQVWLNGESANGLPFIDVFFRSTALLDIAHPTSILYELFSDREDRRRTAYVYDPTNKRLFALETMHGEIVRLDTLEAPMPYYDGLGLFMFARCTSGSDTTVMLPTVMDYDLSQTSIRFSNATEEIDVVAFDDPVQAFSFHGSTTWEGSSFGGMTGDFSGWVSTDSTRTVLKAAVEIFLGSVTIELEERGTP